MDGVREFARTKGFRRVLILGTETTVTQNLYQQCAGEVLYPTKEEQKSISRVIERVLAGKYWQRDRDFIARLLARYRKRKKVDALVLGCTELSVLLKDVKEMRQPRSIDPLKLLASRLIDKGLGL